MAALAALATPQAQAQTDISGTSGYPWDSSNPDISVSAGGQVDPIIHGDTAIYATGSVGTLSNLGLITGNIPILNSGTVSQIDNGSDIPNSVYGTISGNLTGISNGGTIGILSNEGSIIGGTIGIKNAGDINTISNSGLISGGQYGIKNSGTINTLINNAIISGDSYAIQNTGSIGTLNNSGLISAAHFAGIENAINGHIDFLDNSGTILTNSSSTHTAALSSYGSIGILNNRGLISGSQIGIYNQTTGSITALNNSGTITGSLAGVLTSGTITNLNNSGLISSTNYALLMDVNGSFGNISNSGTIAGDILNLSTSAAALNISGGSDATFGTLTGLNGSIGNIVSSGSVIFNSGNLLLNDNISVGAINSAGIGYSTNGIGTVTNAGSILQINNHITITGSYQQNAAATLTIGVGDSAVSNGAVTDTGYGRLIVTGDAVVASGSSITLKNLNTYSFATGQRFVVIQASGSGTNYNAAALNYSVAGYSASGTQVYDGSYYDLVVTVADAITGSTSITNAATNVYTASALNGLFRYSGTDSTMLTFHNAAILAAASSDSANRAGARLNPTATRSAAGNGVTTALNTVQGVAVDRIDGLRANSGGSGDSGSGIASGETSLSPALWGRAFGGRAIQGERDNVSGYHASYGGVIIGGDALVAQDWRLGGLFNYVHTNIGNDGDNSGSSASVNSYGLMAYAGFDGEPWYVNLSAGLARQQYSTTRNVSFSGFDGVTNGSYNGTLYTASAQTGYPLSVAAMTVTPLAGLNYSTLHQNGYTESGGNGAALIVNGRTVNSLKSQLGMKLERNLSTSYGILQPAAQLSWNHEFKDSRLSNTASFAADSTGATSFSTLGATPLRDTAQLSLGATLLRSKNLTLSARYTVEATSGYTAQTGDVTVRWQY